MDNRKGIYMNDRRVVLDAPCEGKPLVLAASDKSQLETCKSRPGTCDIMKPSL